jgi:hypothetical protein
VFGDDCQACASVLRRDGEEEELTFRLALVPDVQIGFLLEVEFAVVAVFADVHAEEQSRRSNGCAFESARLQFYVLASALGAFGHRTPNHPPTTPNNSCADEENKLGRLQDVPNAVR